MLSVWNNVSAASIMGDDHHASMTDIGRSSKSQAGTAESSISRNRASLVSSLHSCS